MFLVGQAEELGFIHRKELWGEQKQDKKLFPCKSGTERELKQELFGCHPLYIDGSAIPTVQLKPGCGEHLAAVPIWLLGRSDNSFV